MSDTADSAADDMDGGTDESAGLGAADPITGVTGAKDDLDDDAQLPDSDEDLDAAGEDGDEDVDLAAGDPEATRAESMDLVTNDAVAGDTVDAGRGDGNDGPTGGAPAEGTPDEPQNDLDPSVDLDARPIDLRDEL